jgi:hypothetical protein
MSPCTYKAIRHAGLSLSAAALMAILEIGIGSLLFQPVQAVCLPLLVVALLGNFLIAVTIPAA